MLSKKSKNSNLKPKPLLFLLFCVLICKRYKHRKNHCRTRPKKGGKMCEIANNTGNGVAITGKAYSFLNGARICSGCQKQINEGYIIQKYQYLFYLCPVCHDTFRTGATAFQIFRGLQRFEAQLLESPDLSKITLFPAKVTSPIFN